MTPTKVCTKCKLELPATSMFFHINRAGNDGLRPDCRKCHNAMNRERYINTDHLKETRKKHRESHRAAYNAASDRFRKKHPERIPVVSKEVARMYTRAWRSRHPDRARASYHRARVKRASIPSEHNEQDVRNQYKRQHGKCYWCNAALGESYHVDHIIPLSRGGSDHPDNLVIACPSCNLSKGCKLPHEWKGSGGRLL